MNYYFPITDEQQEAERRAALSQEERDKEDAEAKAKEEIGTEEVDVEETDEFVIDPDYVVDPKEQWKRYLFDDFETQEISGKYYNEEFGFQSKEDILKRYDEEEIESTGMSFEDFLVNEDYTDPETISKERTKNQLKKQLYSGEGDFTLSKEDVNFNTLKEYLTGATSPIADLNLNISSYGANVSSQGPRQSRRLTLTAPSLVGIKFNGEDLVDEDGMVSIYTEKDGSIKQDAFLEIVRLLDEQKNDVKGDLTILNSLFSDVTTGDQRKYQKGRKLLPIQIEQVFQPGKPGADIDTMLKLLQGNYY